MSKIFLFILFLVAGALSAVGFIYILGTAPVRFDNPILTTFDVKKPEIVGFLPYWLVSKADKDYSKYITTLTYFGLTLNNDGTVKKLNNPQEEEPGWTALKADKYQKYNAKQSLLVVSGDDGAIGDMISNPVASANNLIADVAPIMKDKGFTDLNLDIESFMDASESARANFTLFVQTVTLQIKDRKLGTVTLDLIPISLVKSKIYDAKALSSIVDRIVLMTYDYHYTGSLTTGAVAPLSGAGTTIEYDVETAVKEALKAMPADKILLGIPLYGYEWETIGDASESATIPGGSSIASSGRVADLLSGCATCSAVMDPVSREPYVIYPENGYFNQIYFENEASMKEKIALAQTYHLGGVALWALGYEDATMLTPLSTYKNTLDLSGLY
ncbi:MAG: glycosyl hydrolase family 18 protein [Candidatus Gottesmanbacteria bacterium]|nr:glycosyl hydrolase family 18 protein [Candidatus Gottesmanbacteria bacterium]